MNGYCGECDKQIEFDKVNIIQRQSVDGMIFIYLKCPWCEKAELITKFDIND